MKEQLNKITIELIKKWIEALRGGKYYQGKGQLCTPDEEYCCLGVLVDIINGGKQVRNKIYNSPLTVGDTLNAEAEKRLEMILHHRILVDTLVLMNDTQYTFVEIADAIETALEDKSIAKEHPELLSKNDVVADYLG